MAGQVRRVNATPERLAEIEAAVDRPRVNAMADEMVDAARRDDTDALPPMSDAEITAAKAATVRRARAATGLSQSAFASRFRIPPGTVRDWEQARRSPDAAALAYLRVIEREPEAVLRALGAG